MPQYWTLLNENILVWFSLIQGLLLPFCLYVADAPFRDAVRFAFRRNNKQSTDFSDLLFNSKPSTNSGQQQQIALPGYSFAPSSYLTALSDDFCRAEDASLLRIYRGNHLAASQSSLAQQQMDAKSSLNSSNKPSLNRPPIGLQYSNSSNSSQKYGFVNQQPPAFNNSPLTGRLPHKKFVSSNSVNIGGYHSYANNDFLLLDKPLLGGPYSGAIHGTPDPRRSSFSCFLSTNGFPGYSTTEKNNQYYSSSKLNNDHLLTPTIKCYQQLFANSFNSFKFEQQLNTLNNPQFVNCVSNGKFPAPAAPYNQLHMTKTNPVYLTNEHFLPNSRKSVATSEIAFGNEKEIDKFKLDQRKSLCEGYQLKDQLMIDQHLNRQFSSSRPLNQLQTSKLIKNSNNRLYDSPENSLECPLLDQLNSLAASSDCGNDYQCLVAKNHILKPNTNNGKFKCSRLANIGLLSNVASLSQTGVRATSHQSKMSRLLGNRKLDLKQAANKQKQRRSFSGEINCELLNSLDSVDREINDWPQLIEEVEASKSDTERDGCETIWNFSIKNQATNENDKHVYGCVYDDKAVVKKSDKKCDKIDDLSLKRPKLIVDDQLNLVDIENAIRNSTNLLNLSVFNVASDEEDSETGNKLNLELLKNKEKSSKDKKHQPDASSVVDDFELANDDFEFHTTKSIGVNKSPELANESSKNESSKNESSKNESSVFKIENKLTNQIRTDRTSLKESNSFKEIKLAKQDSKVNGLFKKHSKQSPNEANRVSSTRVESDNRRKSITSITPLCNQNRPLLNGKQSKSVSDLTAQFENCILNNHQMTSKEKAMLDTSSGPPIGKQRSTSESNLLVDGKETNLLPTSTALMLQLIKQSNHPKNGVQSPTNKQIKSGGGSETITRRKKVEPLRKTSSASSSDTNYSTNNSDDQMSRRQNRYLKKDERKIKKEMSRQSIQSMLPIPASNGKKDSKSRIQQPPHFRLLSASGLSNGLPNGLSNGLNLPRTQLSNGFISSSTNKANYQIRSTPVTILSTANGLRTKSTVHQPIYRSTNVVPSHSQITNRTYQSNMAVQSNAVQHRMLNNRQTRELELRRSNSTTSLALDPNCLLSNVRLDLKQSMPNLSQSKGLFPYSFQ